MLYKDYAVEWLGDSKQVEAFLQRVGLEEARPVDIPGVKHDRDANAPLLEGSDPTRHRSLVALLNFIAQDRAEFTVAAHNLARQWLAHELGTSWASSGRPAT